MGRYIFESLFDVGYLGLVFYLGYLIITQTKAKSLARIFGYMTIVLVAGDMFHLVPRVLSYWIGDNGVITAAANYGKLITSITMTIFYVMMYYYWQQRYAIKPKPLLNVAIIALTFIRIVLCLLPANEWLATNPPYSWGIYRNIPFVLMGIIMISLFYYSKDKIINDPMQKMWIAISLSFIFYLIVVLLVDFIPLLGMMMIPKTIAYIWMVIMGYRTINETIRS